MTTEKLTKKIRIRKENIKAFFALIFYKISLDVSYYLVIARVWGYQGFSLDLNAIKLIVSYILLLIVFFSMPKSVKKLSGILTWLLVLFAYVPVLTVYAMANKATVFVFFATLFWLFLFFFLRMPTLAISSFDGKQARAIYFLFFFGLTISVILLVYRYIGFSLNFDLLRVYEIRAYYKSSIVTLGVYLINWLASIVNPMFIVIFLRSKKYLPAALILGVQILLFSVTGNKFYLFLLPFLFAVLLDLRTRHPFALAALSLGLVVLAGSASYFIFGDLWVSALFANRTLLTPALLSFDYYDFFSQKENQKITN